MFSVESTMNDKLSFALPGLKNLAKNLESVDLNPEPTKPTDPESKDNSALSSNVAISTETGNILTRNAMGEYIVPPGGKPLTSLACANLPGPADYCPKMTVTKPSMPHYSLVGKSKSNEYNKNPGPADYRDDRTLLWKRRTITIKGRVKETTFANQAACDIGPAKYKVEHLHFGKDGPKHSMVGRKPFVLRPGPPDRLVQGVDTHGFVTPGPDYRPNSGYWGRGPKKSMGIQADWQWEVNHYPAGPADYDLSSLPKWDGPGYSLAKRFSDPAKIKPGLGPAPNGYDVGTTIGKAVAISITGRKKSDKSSARRGNPAPNTYSLKDSFDLTRKAATITYRWLDDGSSTLPGPCHYNVKHPNLRNSPAYICGQRQKTFAGEYNQGNNGNKTGPGSYDLMTNFSDNGKPAFSMGRRLEAEVQRKETPGPAKYNIKGKPGRKAAPTYSMAKRLDKTNATIGPGPAFYNPQVETSAPKYTMTERPAKIKTQKITPAPYRIKSGVTRKGNLTNDAVSFKSRASPFVYSGFRTNKLMEPLPAI